MAQGCTWLHAQAYATYRFTFDRVYGPEADQQEVYEHSAKRTVLSTLQVPRNSAPTAIRTCCPSGQHASARLSACIERVIAAMSRM
jgi:hypothetical protein